MPLVFDRRSGAFFFFEFSHSNVPTGMQNHVGLMLNMVRFVVSLV